MHKQLNQSSGRQQRLSAINFEQLASGKCGVSGQEQDALGHLLRSAYTAQGMGLGAAVHKLFWRRWIIYEFIK